jgi:valyl-tRNA synthetase
MMSKHLTGQMPFKHVYIHGLVRDEAGKKMSKSSNNGVDPLVLIDQYGTDALRYTLIKEVAGAGQDISLRLNRQLYALNVVKRLIGQTPENQLIDKLQAYLKDLRSGKSTPELIKVLQADLKEQTNNAKPIKEFTDRLTQNLETLEKSLQEREPLSESVEASRNFANKLWNASRFVLMNLDGQTPAQLGQPDKAKLEVSDRWILSRFNQVTQNVRQNLENHALGEAAKQMYEFIWGDFCDWYIELAKSRLNGEDKASRKVVQQVLAQVLEGILKLLHPFMPHITEEIWHTLTQQPKDGKASLATQLYPEIDASLINSELEQNFELLIGTIRTVRNLRAEAGIKPGERIEAILQTEDDREHHILTEGWFYIKDLAKVKTLSISQPNGARAVAAVAGRDAVAGTTAYGSKAWSEMTWMERFQLDEVLQIVGNFFATYQRQLLVSGALGLFVLVMEILRAILDTVHQVPFLPSVLEMVGLGYSLWYGKQNLWQSADRDRTWQQVQQLKQDVIGAPRLIATTDATPAQAIAGISSETTPTEGSQMFAGVVGTVQVLIPLAGLVDVQALRGKLEKDLGKLDGEIQSLNARLTNPKFVDKAPADVVQAVRDSLTEAAKQAAILQGRLNML